MALNKEERKKLDETHDTVIILKALLLGDRGDNGMVGDFKRLSKSHYNLRTRFWLLVGILAGSGLLSGGIYGIIQAI